MMLKFWILCVSLCVPAAGAWGQTAPAAQKPAQAITPQTGVARPAGQDDDDQNAAAAAAAVPTDAPVLTIKGYCPGQDTSAGKSCETIITRAQFEQIAAGVQPAMSRSVKQQLAGVYPRLLVMAHEAEVDGLDKQPQVESAIAMARLRILADALNRKMQADTAKATEQDISDYYNAHPEVSEEYTLLRLFIPLRKEPPPAPDSKTPKLTPEEQAKRDRESEEEMSRLAEALQKRAAAGEDFLKLQKEALDAAGDKVEAPNVSMGTVRRTTLPASHTVIFTMKVGEVSPVVSDAGGHYIYELQGKNKLSLGEVHTEIRIMLGSQRMREAMDKLQNSFTAEKNEAYFGQPHPATTTTPK
jgi:hypothetical protein